MKRLRRGSGFTLIEALVGAGLLALVLTLSLQCLTPILNIFSLNQARAEVEQTGLILETRMARELVRSNPQSVTILASDPPAVSFLSFGPENTVTGYDPSTGKTVWQSFVIYYLDTENGILYRKQWPGFGHTANVPPLPYVFPTSTPVALQSAQLQAICSTENGTEAWMANYVQSLTVANPTGQALSLDLQMSTESINGSETAHRHLNLTMRN